MYCTVFLHQNENENEKFVTWELSKDGSEKTNSNKIPIFSYYQKIPIEIIELGNSGIFWWSEQIISDLSKYNLLHLAKFE